MNNNIANLEINPAFTGSISKEQAWHYRIIPKVSTDTELVLFGDEEADIISLADELEIVLGKTVVFELLPSAVVNMLLNKHYLKENGQHQFQGLALAIEGDGFLNDLIRERAA